MLEPLYMFFDIVELKHTHVDERHVIIHVGIIHVGFLVNFCACRSPRNEGTQRWGSWRKCGLAA